MSKKFIYTAIIIVVLIGGILGYNYYQKIFGEAILKKTILFVNSTDTLNDIKNNLVGVSKNQSFLFVAAKKNFLKPKVGRYILKEGMSNNDIVEVAAFKLVFPHVAIARSTQLRVELPGNS